MLYVDHQICNFCTKWQAFLHADMHDSLPLSDQEEQLEIHEAFVGAVAYNFEQSLWKSFCFFQPAHTNTMNVQVHKQISTAATQYTDKQTKNFDKPCKLHINSKEWFDQYAYWKREGFLEEEGAQKACKFPPSNGLVY